MEVVAGMLGVGAFWMWLGSILFCAQGAYSKGRSQVLWLIAGILWGPLALLALAAFAPKPKTQDVHIVDVDRGLIFGTEEVLH